MPARKRGRQEAELDSSIVAIDTTHRKEEENPTLVKLRSMWQFAAFMQYLFLFGRVVKVDDDFDMDEFEMECLKPEPSTRLQEVGLALLKYVSSHRGLTMDIFDEYTRRQYEAKAPKRNPFGVEEEPAKFLDMDVFTKVRVLHQLSVWTLGNVDRVRQQMAEQTEREQTVWRIEELGWDREERAYFVLDDDRLYRRTEKPIPPTPKKTKPKPKPKARKSRGTRSSKRQKLIHESEGEEEADEETQDTTMNDASQQTNEEEDDDFGGMKWECVAVTIEQYQDFLESIRRSTDPNEKLLRKRIQDDIMPVMEEKAEKQRQKALKKQRELENLQKLATAKRSSRIAGRQEEAKKREEDEAAEKKRMAELAMAKKEQEKQRKMEQARESRMLTREQRLKDREVKRILHEEELKRLEENSKNAEQGEGRMSERNLKLEMERRQKELDKLAEEEDEWIFDCSVCGMHGENLDDGTHSVACEKCNIWQHSKCHGIREEDAEREDFHFVCNDCVRKEEEARKPRIPPLRLRMGPSQSPQLERAHPVGSSTPQPNGRPQQLMDGPALSPQGQSPGPPGYHHHRPSPVGIPQQPWLGSTLPPPARPTSAGYNSSPPRPVSHHTSNGHAPSPPPFQLHQQAHASALSSAHLPHPYQPQQHGQPNGHHHMAPPSPQKANSRPSTAYDPNDRRTSPNGSTMTPNHHHHQQYSQQPTPLSYSPNTSFPPPNRPQQFQQAAGHSPTKLPSSSPAHHNQYIHNTPSNSQQTNYAAATPQPQMSGSHQNILRPSPGAPMHSSPIPPLPTGNTPLIPQKHDTPRPASRDSVGPIPPGIKMSPSPASFARPSSSAGAPPPPLNPTAYQSFGSYSSGPNSERDHSQANSFARDNAAAGFPTLPPSERKEIADLLHPSEQERLGSAKHPHQSGHGGERVEDGGIAGVETEFGAGSVPVKKMPPMQKEQHRHEEEDQKQEQQQQHGHRGQGSEQKQGSDQRVELPKSNPPAASAKTGFNVARGGPAVVGITGDMTDGKGDAMNDA